MMLRQKEMEQLQYQTADDEYILDELKKFGTIKRSLQSEGTIEFWAKNKNAMKDVYELSIIVNAVPVTQVTVERAFSSLAFILTALRNSLKLDTLENILLIRLNKEIYEEIPQFFLE